MVPTTWLIAGMLASAYVAYRLGYHVGRVTGEVRCAYVFHALFFGPRPERPTPPDTAKG